MKKTTCSCGRIINMGEKCKCKKENRKIYMKTYESDPLLNTYRWKKKAESIKKRDGGICLRCLYKYNQINNEELQVHHIKSRKHFPELTFDDDNLITICKTCNLQLGTKDKLDFELRNKNDIEFNL